MVLVLRSNLLLISMYSQSNKQCMSEEIKNQKQTLADLLDPLIKKEALKYPDIRKLPSPTDVVEELIRRIGSNKARAENDHTMPLHDFRHIKVNPSVSKREG